MVYSKYFSTNELKCQHCGECHMDADFIIWLDKLRESWNKPMHLSSAYRCPVHNAVESSTGANGPHTTGKAVDVIVDRGEAFRFIWLAMSLGVMGLGINQKGANRFIHIDMIKNGEGGAVRPTVWSY